MKLNKAKTAKKTAKFQATMARKRAMKKLAIEGPSVGIPLDAIPDRLPRGIYNVAARVPASALRPQGIIAQAQKSTAIELLRVALRLLEGKA